MAEIAFVIGAWAGAVILVLVALLAAGHLWDLVSQRRMAREEHQRRVDFAREMRSVAHWFSEDPSTMCVIKRLGAGDDVARVWKDWRHERALVEPRGAKSAHPEEEQA